MRTLLYDINDYLKSDATLKTNFPNNVVKMHPMVGYENSTAPFVLYWWNPGMMSKELYFVRVDVLRYHIFDTSVDRGYNISERMVKLLNKGDGIQGLVSSSVARPLWSVLMRSNTGAFNASMGAPGEREGYYEFQLLFEVGYVPLNSYY